MKKKLYLVGQNRVKMETREETGIVWDFQGIFSTIKKARKACRSKYYFVATVELNKELPDEKLIFPIIEFPVKP